MKSIRNMTREQLYELAALGLEDIINWDDFMDFVKINRKPSAAVFRLEDELWDKDANLMVRRLYLQGNGDTYFGLWEVDNENLIDITVVKDKDPHDVSNLVVIVKKLIEWGFV